MEAPCHTGWASIIMTHRKLRILHIIYKLFCAGGCERLLSDVLKHSDRNAYSHSVISLSDGDERARLIEHTLNIPYLALDMEHEPQRLPALVCACQPDIIKTWLACANITGGAIGQVFKTPVIWGLHSAMPPEQFPDEIHFIKKQVHLSRFLPKRIVCCSEAVYDLCVRMGFDPKLLVTITNGTDTDLFTHRPEGRRRIRRSLKIGEDSPLIGMAAIYVSSKGHDNFLEAAKLLLASYPNAHFLLCGMRIDAYNATLTSAIARLGLKKRVHLLGIRDDMADIYSALDIHTLNSKSESFGLATTEAMACKTLCVATDVGIAKALVAGVGAIIPAASHPSDLAAAWQALLTLAPEEKARYTEAGRERIKKRYSIAETAKQYDAPYREYA